MATWLNIRLEIVSWWGGLINLYGPLQKEVLTASFPKSCAKDKTWHSIMKWACWSFCALVTGLRPTHDPDGAPFFTTRGLRAVIWCVIGGPRLLFKHLEIAPLAIAQPLLGVQRLGRGFTVVPNSKAREHPNIPGQAIPSCT